MKDIRGPHCQSCGSTDPEDIFNLVDTEGYTRCCNERVVTPVRQQMNYSTGRYFDVPVDCDDFGDCYHD